MNATLLAIGTALVVLVTLALVLRPLVQARHTAEVGASLWVLLLGFPVAVILIYAQVTTYPWGNPSPAASSASAGPTPVEQEDQSTAAIEQMVAGLAQRLETESNDLQGWEMLGRSYMELRRYPEAAEALRKAWQLSEGERVDIAVNFAEALAMSDAESLRAGAGDLLDAVLEENPNNAKALWYGGLSSAARGQVEIAVQRWSTLLADPNLPPNIRQLVQSQLAAIGADVPLPQGAEPGGPMFRVSIALAPGFADQVQPGQSLFVFARDADSTRPPVAVKRLVVDQFPMSTTLRDADVMMPGLKLTGMENLRVVARISQAGNAMETAGDLFGEVFPEPLGRESQKISLVIDQVVK